MNDANLERLEYLVLLNSRPPIDIDLVDQLAHEYERRSLHAKALSLYFGINDIDRVYSLFTKIVLANPDPNSSQVLWYTSHFPPSSYHSSNPKPPHLTDKNYTLPFYPLHHLLQNIKSASLDDFHISFSTIDIPLILSDLFFHILKHHFPIHEYATLLDYQISPNTLPLTIFAHHISSYPPIILTLLSNYSHIRRGLIEIRNRYLKIHSSSLRFRPPSQLIPSSFPSLLNSLNSEPSAHNNYNPEYYKIPNTETLLKLDKVSNLLLDLYSPLSNFPKDSHLIHNLLWNEIFPSISSYISDYDISSILLHHYFKSCPFFIL